MKIYGLSNGLVIMADDWWDMLEKYGLWATKHKVQERVPFVMWECCAGHDPRGPHARVFENSSEDSLVA